MTPWYTPGKMLQLYSMHLRIYSWFMKYYQPKIGIYGRHRCFPGDDVGRRQQQRERKGRRADAEEEKGERERGEGDKEKEFFCGVGPTCGSWYGEGYRVWMGAEERDIEQRILMTRT